MSPVEFITALWPEIFTIVMKKTGSVILEPIFTPEWLKMYVFMIIFTTGTALRLIGFCSHGWNLRTYGKSRFGFWQMVPGQLFNKKYLILILWIIHISFKVMSWLLQYTSKCAQQIWHHFNAGLFVEPQRAAGSRAKKKKRKRRGNQRLVPGILQHSSGKACISESPTTYRWQTRLALSIRPQREYTMSIDLYLVSRF